MKVMFSAGEASGDTHAASVANALKEIDPSVDMFGMGGTLMERAGVRIVYDIKNLGVIGIVEIVKSLPKFFKLRTYLKRVMMKEKPDILVCVDYPGFNMKLAAVAHELGIPVLYYIAPTIWAWHSSRGNTIRKYVTKVASIFPFEAEAYRKYKCDVEFVGHPLLDIVHPTMTKDEAEEYFGARKEAKKVLLMPGSRKQEVLSLLDTMLKSGEQLMANHEDIQFFLPRAHTIDRSELETFIDAHKVPVTITEDHTYDLMQICDVCLAASGTATLETAMMELPTVLLYRVSPITYGIGKMVVNVSHVGLPNIVAGKEVIPELLQDSVTPQAIVSLVEPLLTDVEKNKAMRSEYIISVRRNVMNSYSRLLYFVKPYYKRMIFAVFCMIVAAAAYLVVPWLIKNVVDQVLDEKNMFMLNLIVGAIILIFLIRGFATYGQTYNMSYIGQRVIIDVREAIFNHLQKLSLSYFDRRKTGVIMSNLTNDVAALQSAVVDNLISFITESVTLIGSLVSMLLIDWKLTLVTFITVPVVLVIINVFGKKLRVAGHDVQGRVADITALLQEVISAIRVVKSFAREDFERKRFEDENDRNFKAVIKATKLTSLLSPMVEFSAAIAVAVILWYGGYSVVTGTITAGSLIAFLIYAINLSNPVKRLSQVYGNIQKALAAADRVFEILDTKTDVVEKADATTLPSIKGDVEFKDVSFSYDGEKTALENFTLSVKAGESVALVGPSGAGKTTLANLLPRFYDVTGGALTIDGYNVKDVTFKSLREQIGLVPQETVLFNATIKENILYGRLDATDEEVYEAAKAANVLEFVEKMPDGLDTVVGERGSSLSGGQRQRVAIARAILKDPRILILDEATSALDTESEKLVQEALDRLMKGRTAFVIAHRLSTVQNAHQIVVLNQGHLVEQGTHQELLAVNGGLYNHLYSVQFSNKG